MFQKISQTTAQQIVDTVKDVCGYDINFINTEGKISASTNHSRIGTFHEVGYKAIQTSEIIEVSQDDSFFGTMRGVNLPFQFHGETIAAIGISGDPEAVRKYAFLAQRITYLILRERELDSRNRDEQAEINYLVHSLTHNGVLTQDMLPILTQKYHLSTDRLYRSIVIRLNAKYNPVNLSMIDQKIQQVFQMTGNPLYSFEYPIEYVQLISDDSYHKWDYLYKKLATDYTGLMTIGVGSPHPLPLQGRSYEEALLADRAVVQRPDSLGFLLYEDLDIEIITGSLPDSVIQHYLQKTIRTLNNKERHTLRVYFNNNSSIKETAKQLYIHPNTLQYQLRKIAAVSGYDPHIFRDAAVLYLALKIQSD